MKKRKLKKLLWKAYMQGFYDSLAGDESTNIDYTLTQKKLTKLKKNGKR